MAQTYSLPPLPYEYNALEPAISATIMELHHSKHHNTYVTNLNKALHAHAEATKVTDLPAIVALEPAIKFNAGGHINHSLFWTNLTPQKSPEASPDSAPKLHEAIRQQWGDRKTFQQKFNEQLLGIQGSGWGWLVRQGTTGPLVIVTTKDQDIVGKDQVPIFGVDMWEHAYYLQAAYVENIWTVINWKTAEERYLGGNADAFKVLKAAI
ncbi:Superoxide dismutase [Mn], mitochondrial [Monascus purpureus]|uniref:Superoxide dismutase n=1 Tax=Monascus purpureus TaxID=5098 RepID=A0A507QL28_MONPU|nr:Superoxide dismutase [Mn], mitochondrial [Monascus purpureus]